MTFILSRRIWVGGRSCWQHGREVAVQVRWRQSKLGEEQGRAGVVGGGSWCCPAAGADILLSGAGADMLLFAAGADTLSL